MRWESRQLAGLHLLPKSGLQGPRTGQDDSLQQALVLAALLLIHGLYRLQQLQQRAGAAQPPRLFVARSLHALAGGWGASAAS